MSTHPWCCLQSLVHKIELNTDLITSCLALTQHASLYCATSLWFLKHVHGNSRHFYVLLQCKCSCPMAADGPSMAPTMAPATAPAADSAPDSSLLKNSCNRPVPTQYEAFKNVSGKPTCPCCGACMLALVFYGVWPWTMCLLSFQQMSELPCAPAWCLSYTVYLHA